MLKKLKMLRVRCVVRLHLLTLIILSKAITSLLLLYVSHAIKVQEWVGTEKNTHGK